MAAGHTGIPFLEEAYYPSPQPDVDIGQAMQQMVQAPKQMQCPPFAPFDKPLIPFESCDPHDVARLEDNIKKNRMQSPSPLGHKWDMLDFFDDDKIEITESTPGPGGVNVTDVETMAQTDGGNSYEIIRYIAGGSFGHVYEVKLINTNWGKVQYGTRLALKIVKMPTGLSDEQAIDTLTKQMTEASILLDIGRTIPVHPNLLNAYEIITKEGMNRVYLVMKLSEYGSLQREAFKRWNATQGWLSPEEIRHLARGIADGIRFLKQRLAVAHCDIKPDNVILFDNPQQTGEHNMLLPKLADFSNSVKRKPNNNPDFCQAVAKRCTIGFHAPETYIKEMEYDAYAADVYSLACNIYWMWKRETLTKNLAGFEHDVYNETNIVHVLKQQKNAIVRQKINDLVQAIGVAYPTVNCEALRRLLTKNLEVDFRIRTRLTIEKTLLHDYFQL